MSKVLETAKTMTREALFAKAEGLMEFGMERVPVTEKWARVNEERDFWQNPVRAVAALNNADLNHALLARLKENPEKVLDGLGIAAQAVSADEKLLVLPEGEETLAEELKNLAAEYGTRIETGIVDVRKNRGGAYHHFETLIALAEIFEGTRQPAVYLAVCKDGKTGPLQKVSCGTKLADVLAENGADPENLGAVALGNTIYPAEAAAEMTLTEETPTENGVVTVYPKTCCMVHEANENLKACQKASCGKCTFCREGLIQLQASAEEITKGQAEKGCTALMEEIGSAMAFSTQCTLGKTAAAFLLGTLTYFGEEYEEHIRKKKCANNVCSAFSTIYIDPNECQGCEECTDVCPADAIEGKKGFIHMIDEYECTKCGKCIEACEYEAIILTTGKVPKLPNRLMKVGKFRKH